MFGHGAFDSPTKVFRDEGLESDYSGNKVKLFQHCKDDGIFSDGWTITPSVGTHQLSDSKNDKISSIYVPDGYKVTLYEHFLDWEEGGETKVLTGPTTVHCLADITGPSENNDWNDIVSAYKVETTASGGDNTTDCATLYREEGLTTGTCGACKSDYTQDENGVCVKTSSLGDNGESSPLFCWKCPLGYVLGGVGVLAAGYIYFMIKHPGYFVAGQAIGAGGNVLSKLID